MSPTFFAKHYQLAIFESKTYFTRHLHEPCIRQKTTLLIRSIVVDSHQYIFNMTDIETQHSVPIPPSDAKVDQCNNNNQIDSSINHNNNITVKSPDTLHQQHHVDQQSVGRQYAANLQHQASHKNALFDVEKQPADFQPTTAIRLDSLHRTLMAVSVTAIAVCACLVSIACLAFVMGWPIGWDVYALASVSVIVASVVLHWCGRWLYVAAMTVRRDLTAMYRYLHLLRFVHSQQKRNATIADVFELQVARHPHKACLIFEGRTWTFSEINEFANRVANCIQADGHAPGAVIALLMDNRPEFVAIWLGLSKAGIVVPLINTNLRQATLLHSLTVARCSGLIFGDSLRDAVADIAGQLSAADGQMRLYAFGDESPTTHLPNVIDLALRLRSAPMERARTVPHSASRHHGNLMYIYTSGTTGLPKAAVITHARFMFIAAGIHYIGQLRSDDVYYTPLPLYHTAGGVMCVGQALLFGSTVVLRRKFSASAFFADCAAHNCTVAQYIGEMCRFMLAAKPSASDTQHNVRVMFGNGLRPQIWPQFVQRFRIARVAEFYGATEGNANIVNVDNTVGSIGFVSRIMPFVYPISIIRADPDTGEPIRGPDGLCRRCAPNEPGVFIGKIIPNNPSRAFLGYVDRSASSKKIVHDVFAKGDAAFLSGDVLIADEFGYLYFKDRTGDTFRWKGENVSTTEVEALVSSVAALRDTIVYGVQVPNVEGRAGMAAIHDESGTLDVAGLAAGIREQLPSYARPQFLRVLRSAADMTSTFKLKKTDLLRDGFDPARISDELYYMTTAGTYETLTGSEYDRICLGEILGEIRL